MKSVFVIDEGPRLPKRADAQIASYDAFLVIIRNDLGHYVDQRLGFIRPKLASRFTVGLGFPLLLGEEVMISPRVAVPSLGGHER